MRVFLTGATGFIGSAIVKELTEAGHQVLGFARSDASAASLKAAGVEVHRGALEDLDSLKRGAQTCDGVIHTAFIHDFSQFMVNVETDRRAVEAMVSALQDSGKPLVITSGSMMVAHGRPATEQDAPMSVEVPRAASEAMVLAADRGVRGSVVRLAPTVHGAGDHGFVPRLINIARETGLSAYVGDGANVWPAVHRLDAAHLYRLALENAEPGTRLHGIAEEGIPFRAIAEAIGAGLGIPVRSLTANEAPAHFDFLARFVATDNPVSSAITRKSLGWHPEGPDLLSDMRDNGYFA
ncbi:SDR family oxidoreductase [Rhodanobacter sp. MP1X3]|uniref:SDR family oxidoreductase n=1 Tax=Rhodanobacter sp. MP1X3 TaxID=2723086 RepID=UPI001612712D|nr:SDR family oxidoreductase [Rhodanobacter sp. MP1X3]MBB6243308.1 nucleoside-diphosphate-sugar epimerase [Rhodanobacter sp. MP1X3]